MQLIVTNDDIKKELQQLQLPEGIKIHKVEFVGNNLTIQIGVKKFFLEVDVKTSLTIEKAVDNHTIRLHLAEATVLGIGVESLIGKVVDQLPMLKKISDFVYDYTLPEFLTIDTLLIEPGSDIKAIFFIELSKVRKTDARSS